MTTPPNPPTYPSVSQLQPEEMHRLLKNEDALASYFDALEHVRTMRAVHHDLLLGNEALAKQNLLLEPALVAANEAVEQQQTLLRSQLAAFEEAAKARDDAGMRFTPNYLTAALRTNLTDCEDRSEEITRAFLAGTSAIPIDEFVKQYREARTEYHKRAAKLERLSADPSVLAQL
ncbi:hypothetical protein HDU88_003608 [Geranomyces variabilis]|nr:hypothetical protein BDZ88DRAFT_455204 [Geranomyces variabilis]KAJ3139946.1 hypothetical protein HDU90_008847 [Geranomyces variabilis]KAJ3166063.1 hypothetical protein HDU88_003608 [Geranomyces variabilis]